MAILFLRDWNFYPSAIVDTKTTNESFLKIADTYRQMGIRHWYFMLALHNPRLQGVDPHDPKLTREQINWIQIECRTNVWYYLREVAYLPPSSGIDPIRFKANRGNIALVWCFLNHITSILIQPRQTGKTGSVDILTSWILNIAAINVKMLMLTKGTDLQTDTISRLKEMRNLLPDYIYAANKNDSDNKTGLNNMLLKTEYKTGVSRSNRLAANNLGRGLTAPILHIDEPPFITFIGETLPAAAAAGTFARNEAQRLGAMWGTIMTTTCARRDSRDGKYMYEYVTKSWTWNEAIFDCADLAEAMVMVGRGCRADHIAANITMSHRQLGYSDRWLYAAIQAAGGEKDQIERDFMNYWNSGSATNPIPVHILQIISGARRDPDTTTVTAEKYTLRWYTARDELHYILNNIPVVLGCDPSEAAGRDSMALIWLNGSSMAVLGSATIGLASTIEFATWLARYMIEAPRVTLMIERKSTGPMIIDMLLSMLPAAGVDPFRRIYNSIVNDAQDSTKGQEAYSEILRPMSTRDSLFYTERKTTFGFKTDSAKRQLLLGNVLQQAAARTAKTICDVPLATELLGLTVRNDRVDHGTETHDDHVIAWVLCHWMLTISKNLSHYGINVVDVMKELRVAEVEAVSAETAFVNEKREAYQDEIERIIKILETEDSKALVEVMNQRLRYLTTQLKQLPSDRASQRQNEYSMDALNDRITQARRQSQRLSDAGVKGVDPDFDNYNRIQDQVASYKQNGWRAKSDVYQMSSRY